MRKIKIDQNKKIDDNEKLGKNIEQDDVIDEK